MINFLNNRFKNTISNENDFVRHYTDYSEEVNSVKYGVGIYNRSGTAVLKLSGKDVLEFLQRITTNDVSSLESNSYKTTLFANEKGRLIDRTSLIRIDDDYFLVGSKKNEAVLQRWIEKYIITEDVKIENYSQKYVILDIIGPQAESYLTLICGKDVEGLENNILHKINVEGIESVLLKKEGYKESLFWLFSKIENAIPLLDFMLDRRSVFDLSMIGEEAFNLYRVSNKIPAYPNEINVNFNPHEAGLIGDISFSKGCYLGQEIITRLKTYDKVQKQLEQIIIEDKVEFSVPVDLIDSENNYAGTLTTVVPSLQNNHLEGLAYIRTKYKENRSELNFIVENDSKKTIKLKIVG